MAIIVIPPHVFRKRVKTENLERIRLGMTKPEVEHLLGKSVVMEGYPSSQAGGRIVYSYWEDGKDVLVVFFENNRVCGGPMKFDEWTGARVRGEGDSLIDRILDFILYPVQFWLVDVW